MLDWTRRVSFAYHTSIHFFVLQIDLDHLESLVDSSTACILICNPSNPTGSVFSETHLRAIVATAEKLKVPILSDEVSGKSNKPLPSSEEKCIFLYRYPTPVSTICIWFATASGVRRHGFPRAKVHLHRPSEHQCAVARRWSALQTVSGAGVEARVDHCARSVRACGEAVDNNENINDSDSNSRFPRL